MSQSPPSGRTVIPERVEETPDLQGAYPRLSEAQIAVLAALGHRRATRPGEILFRQGQRDCDFFVVLAGNVAVVDGHGHRLLAPMHAGTHQLTVVYHGGALERVARITVPVTFP